MDPSTPLRLAARWRIFLSYYLIIILFYGIIRLLYHYIIILLDYDIIIRHRAAKRRGMLSCI